MDFGMYTEEQIYDVCIQAFGELASDSQYMAYAVFTSMINELGGEKGEVRAHGQMLKDHNI
jgi:hypothetical protein